LVTCRGIHLRDPSTPNAKKPADLSVWRAIFLILFLGQDLLVSVAWRGFLRPCGPLEEALAPRPVMRHTKKPADLLGLAGYFYDLVAGAGFEPAAFRL
jgi:hypothetical protein